MPESTILHNGHTIPCVSSAGRLCNNIIVCLAVSILAEKHNLAMEYKWQDKIELLGIKLYNKGTNVYDTSIVLTDSNYSDILHCTNLTHNLHLEHRYYLQTPFVSNLLYNELRKEYQMNSIISHNKFKDRYTTNNDCIVHIRLGDIVQYNPGLEYYMLAISKCSFTNLYITTDSPDYPLIIYMMNEYPNVKLLEYDETDTIHFASTCKYVVLSHGSFSALIGYMAFFSEVYYPFFEKLPRIWHGDMFSILGWNKIEY